MSFETLVRPFVYRPIRPPAPALPVVPEDTPEQGIAVLRGLGGKLIDLSYSETSSWSRSKAVETKRVVDVERVYQKDPASGKKAVNRENYVDIERMKKLTMQNGNGTKSEYMFTEPDYLAPDRYNIETLEKDVTIINPQAPKPAGDIEEGGTPP